MSHSRLSPSGSGRWMVCPGSVVAESGYEDTTSPAAMDGTQSHFLLEYCIQRNMTDARVNVGQEFPGDAGQEFIDPFTVEADRADRVNVGLNYIGIRKDEMSDDGVKRVEVIPELKVDAGVLIGRTDLAGTTDVLLVSNTEIEVIDYKDGYNYVAAEGNTQLFIYLLGALARYVSEPADIAKLPFVSFAMTIVQPKLEEQGLNPVSTWRVTSIQVREFIETLRAAAAATDAIDAPRFAGDVQCKWCKAKPNCTALKDQALEQCQVLLTSDNQLVQPHQIAQVEPDGFNDQQLAEVVLALPLLKTFIEAVQNAALDRLKLGVELPGLKVVRGRGSRGWNESEEVILKKLTGMGIPKDSRFTHKVVSPAQLEKLSWVSKKEEKRLTDTQLKTFMGKFCHKVPGSLTTVPTSDSRPSAIESSAALMQGAVVVDTIAPAPTDGGEDTLPELPSFLTGNF